MSYIEYTHQKSEVPTNIENLYKTETLILKMFYVS